MTDKRDGTRTYRILGQERVTLTRRDLEALVREGLIKPSTFVFGEGEAFAVPISAREECAHLTSGKVMRQSGRTWVATQSVATPAIRPPAKKGRG
jgi:hypothetical protein